MIPNKPNNENEKPDKWDEYGWSLEEEMIKEESQGKGGGGGEGTRSRSKAHSEAVTRSQETRKKQQAEKIKAVVEYLVTEAKEVDQTEEVFENYLKWLNKAIRQPEYIPTSDEITVSFSRSTGPGGQNVNKRETAVTVIHDPTGITAESSKERNQFANRKRAEETLKEKVHGHLDSWKEYLYPESATEDRDRKVQNVTITTRELGSILKD